MGWDGEIQCSPLEGVCRCPGGQCISTIEVGEPDLRGRRKLVVMILTIMDDGRNSPWARRWET